MTHKNINPDSLYNSLPMGNSQAVRSELRVSIHCSGQIAWDINDTLVGEGDIDLQARQALSNLEMILKKNGATISGGVQIRTYVVNHNLAYLEPIGQAISEFYGDITPTADTLIGVQSLALPGLMLEIEAIAEII